MSNEEPARNLSFDAAQLKSLNSGAQYPLLTASGAEWTFA